MTSSTLIYSPQAFEIPKQKGPVKCLHYYCQKRDENSLLIAKKIDYARIVEGKNGLTMCKKHTHKQTSYY